ncbi:hypothetical protein CHKEEEPN_3844 [Methylorubrum podarium]|nr:hypothetical protein CHKEEEPN_3844 [Methylorubrum podarium]
MLPTLSAWTSRRPKKGRSPAFGRRASDQSTTPVATMAQPMIPHRKNRSRSRVPAKCASCRPVITVTVLAAGLRPPSRTSRISPLTPSKAIWGCSCERPCGSSNTATTVALASPGLTIVSRSSGSGRAATARSTIGPIGAIAAGRFAGGRGVVIQAASVKKAWALPL